MRVSFSYPGPLLERGMYFMPCMGAAGQHVVFLVTRDHRLLGDRVHVIPSGSDHVRAVEELADQLDAADPITDAERAEIRRRQIRVQA